MENVNQHTATDGNGKICTFDQFIKDLYMSKIFCIFVS